MLYEFVSELSTFQKIMISFSPILGGILLGIIVEPISFYIKRKKYNKLNELNLKNKVSKNTI